MFCNSYWHSIYNGLVLIIFVAMTYSSPEDVHALYINTTTFHPRHLSFGCWGMTIFITSSLHCCAFAFLPSSCQRSFVPFGNFLTAPSRHSQFGGSCKLYVSLSSPFGITPSCPSVFWNCWPLLLFSFSLKISLKSGVLAVTFGNVFTAYRGFLTCFISSWW